MAQNILISTLDNIPNYKIIETKGIVKYSTTSGSFDDVKKGLENEARKLNCNAVINVKYAQNCYRPGQGGWWDLCAFGDAVIIEKNIISTIEK